MNRGKEEDALARQPMVNLCLAIAFPFQFAVTALAASPARDAGASCVQAATRKADPRFPDDVCR